MEEDLLDGIGGGFGLEAQDASVSDDRGTATGFVWTLSDNTLGLQEAFCTGLTESLLFVRLLRLCHPLNLAQT